MPLTHITRAPTLQKFTSGSGTYTLPNGVLWIKVRCVGGGGGGGASPSGTGTAGGNTTFGTIIAGGGSPGASTVAGGAGGTFTTTYPGHAMNGNAGATNRDDA